ncbi:zinc-ribbon domain-containing protein [Myroides sp. WP-1]|uniref:zinc-ribbon domain-containing protein n=1 Tax=Myroides sp. WP-1 TaxID=2759944 RepID=UPI0015FD33EB|nr:zinc ribbon domain-containing protein [Myroides sp. WP-1]MBB1139644.1 zinc ribbon domain-containing protein [Myroides sp. WP-1]
MKNVCQNCQTENEITSKYCSSCGYQLPKIEVETSVEMDSKETHAQSSQKGKRKLNFGALLGIVIGVAVVSFAVNYFSKSSIAIDQKLSVVASEINKNCPMVIDQDIRLDNTVAMPNATFQYNYTLVNYEKAQLNMEVVEQTLFPTLLENARTNPDMKEMREAKVTINYYYKDKKGEFVTKYVITPDMYQNK